MTSVRSMASWDPQTRAMLEHFRSDVGLEAGVDDITPDLLKRMAETAAEPS